MDLEQVSANVITRRRLMNNARKLFIPKFGSSYLLFWNNIPQTR
jgi:hypothetical protein